MTIADWVKVADKSNEYGDIDAYEIDGSPIGEGGFSKVYRVKRNHKHYAMKIPVNMEIDSADTVAVRKEDANAFMEEAGKWADVSVTVPDDVVCLIDCGISPFPWMVMELAQCSFMDAIVAGNATIGDVISILNSLQRVHDAGIVHRDIKPENILSVNGRWKLSDFGLSKLIGTSTESTSGMKGTPQYMAPEQISRKEFGTVDERTDIWQMGIILYRVIMGKFPYDAKDYAELGMAICRDGPDYSDVPMFYREVFDKALSQEKSGRYSSPKEFADALSAISAAEPQSPEEASQEKYNLAMKYYDNGNYKQALDLLTESAQAGFVRAQSMLGYIYSTGDGAPVNGENAYYWYTMAAANGSAVSQYNLGLMLGQGILVPMDLDKAMQLMRSAENGGVIEASEAYAVMKKIKKK